MGIPLGNRLSENTVDTQSWTKAMLNGTQYYDFLGP